MTPPSVTTVTIVPFENMHQFVSLSHSERSNVIKLGLSMYEHGRQTQLAAQNGQWSEEMNSIKSKYEKQISDLRLDRDELNRRFSALTESLGTEKEKAAAEAYQSAQIAFKAQVQNLNEQNNALQQRLSSVIADQSSKTQEMVLELRTFYEDKLQKERGEFEQIRCAYEDRFNAMTGRMQNSTIKGKDSEEELFVTLNRLFPTAVIEDTHTTPGRGDFILRFDDMTMMVENKNYTRNVQKSEVDKFYRDMENPANNDIKCGVLVSMNCGICNKDDFSIEIRSGKPLIFLHNVKDAPEHIKLAAQMFFLIFSQNSLDLSSTEIKSKLSHVAKSIKSNYQKQRNLVDKYHQQQLALLEDQFAAVRDIFQTLMLKF